MAQIMYEIEIRHDGLNKYRLVRGSNKQVVEQKAAAQLATWDEMWQKKVEKEQKLTKIQAKTGQAAARTNQARENIAELENILLHTLSINDAINWESLKDKSKFSTRKPQEPIYIEIPEKPVETDGKYKPKIGFVDSFFSSKKNMKTEQARDLYINDLAEWEKKKTKILEENNSKKQRFQNELNKWESQKITFYEKQEENNTEVDKRKEEYLAKDEGAILDYCSLVLSNSVYPDYFPQDFDLDYNPQSKLLVVDYSLPDIHLLPKIKEVKYVKSKDELAESFLPDSTINRLYDSLIYQIALRTIHELYEADVINALELIVFNGWVNSVDRATGHSTNSCIVSLQTGREEFLHIHLAEVDPKACFKSLKGVSSSKLSSLTPIAPVISINREDKRFTSSYQVVDSLDDSMNLAAMDWEDFEHLIRELFESEFSQSGGEVKVTRASRDGGVDAVAFDPDPIRGGKIVIQAKRYTNTVGVSAVRDLYGTLMNEGATKGILVTTADYGPDAYEFAKGKPLTLLNGSNLLHLLEKHGHRANINLNEAKEILAQK